MESMELNDWIDMATTSMDWESVQQEMFIMVDITEKLSLQVLKNITECIKGDFIAWTSTCKILNTFNTPFEKESRANTFLLLVDTIFPEWKQNGVLMSDSEYLCMDYIYKNLSVDWDIKKLLKNPAISFSNAKKLSGINDNLFYYLLNPNVSETEATEIINGLRFPQERFQEIYLVVSACEWVRNDIVNLYNMNWNWKALSRKKHLDYEVVFALFNVDWDWKAIMKNPETQLIHIEMFIMLGRFDDYKYFIPRNPNVNIDFIIKYPQVPWKKCKPVIGSNQFTIEDMYAITEVNWNWNAYFNHSIKSSYFANELVVLGLSNWKDFVKYDDFSWEFIKTKTNDWFEVELRKDFELIFAENPKRSWNWKTLSKSSYLSSCFFLTHIDESWDWKIISSRKFVIFSIVKAHYDKPWDAKNLSKKHNRF